MWGRNCLFSTYDQLFFVFLSFAYLFHLDLLGYSAVYRVMIWSRELLRVVDWCNTIQEAKEFNICNGAKVRVFKCVRGFCAGLYTEDGGIVFYI